MQDILITQFEKTQRSILSGLKEKYRLSDDDLENIFQTLRTFLFDTIHTVKEGKSAHEKFFSDIILNSIDAIIGYNNEFKIFLWNKGAERIFGYSKEEIMNKDFSVLIPSHLLETGEKEFIITEVINRGFLENHATERITKKGDIINVSISRFAVHTGDEIIGSVGIYRDNTRIKKLEKELREKEQLALIGEVVSHIAHSLSNPLNIISGNADYLLLDKKNSDKDFEELKTIVYEATRITKSIRHLLNFSRPIKLNRDFHDINKLIDRIVHNSKHIAGDKKIEFEKDFHTNLPEIEIDEDTFEEVITNIVSNAIQAISSEGKIKIKTHTHNHSIIIEVEDTGAGIPKENLSKIFLPFFSSKEYGKGTGLGLSLAKRIIQEHGGDIKVKSKPGKGSVFTIKLPVNTRKTGIE